MPLPPVVNIAKRFEETPSEELFALAEQMESLQSTEAWGKLREIVADAKEAARTSLEMGPIREQADYTRWLGYINGFDVLPEIARQIIQAASERRRQLEREAAAERERTEAAAAEA